MSFRDKTLKENLDRISGKSRLMEGEEWRAEVTGIGEDKWSSNGVTYGTPEEAKKWLDNLSGKWFGYDMSRIVPISTPRNEPADPKDPAIYQNFRK